MRLDKAKTYVAKRLEVGIADLADPIAMHDVRRDLGVGRIPVQDLTYPMHAGAMEAKFRIAEVLDVPINSVQKLRELAGPGALI